MGEPEVLDTRPIPEPGEGQILNQITSTMSKKMNWPFVLEFKPTAQLVLPHNIYGRDAGLFIGHKFPYIFGTNVAGIVHTSGDVTAPFKVADKVFGLADVDHPTPDMAGLQEYALLYVNAAAKLPESLTADQLVALPVNAVTLFIALFRYSGLRLLRPCH